MLPKSGGKTDQSSKRRSPASSASHRRCCRGGQEQHTWGVNSLPLSTTRTAAAAAAAAAHVIVLLSQCHIILYCSFCAAAFLHPMVTCTLFLFLSWLVFPCCHVIPGWPSSCSSHVGLQTPLSCTASQPQLVARCLHSRNYTKDPSLLHSE